MPGARERPTHKPFASSMKRFKTWVGHRYPLHPSVIGGSGQFEVFTPSIPARKHDRYSGGGHGAALSARLYIGAAATPAKLLKNAVRREICEERTLWGSRTGTCGLRP